MIAIVLLGILLSHAVLAGDTAVEKNSTPAHPTIGMNPARMLVDENGRPVRIGDWLDEKPLLVAPVYYDCPSVCTVTLNNLVQALNRMDLQPGRDFRVLTYSFDPEEGQELAHRKGEAYRALLSRLPPASGWVFFTGNAGAVSGLSEDLGFGYQKEGEEFVHPPIVYVLNAKGQLVHLREGTALDAADLDFALIDAGGGKIGGLWARISKLAYTVDPATGCYVLSPPRRLLLVWLAFTTALVAGRWTLLLRKRRGIARSPAPS